MPCDEVRETSRANKSTILKKPFIVVTRVSGRPVRLRLASAFANSMKLELHGSLSLLLVGTELMSKLVREASSSLRVRETDKKVVYPANNLIVSLKGRSTLSRRLCPTWARAWAWGEREPSLVRTSSGHLDSTRCRIIPFQDSYPSFWTPRSWLMLSILLSIFQTPSHKSGNAHTHINTKSTRCNLSTP